MFFAEKIVAPTSSVHRVTERRFFLLYVALLVFVFSFLVFLSFLGEVGNNSNGSGKIMPLIIVNESF